MGTPPLNCFRIVLERSHQILIGSIFTEAHLSTTQSEARMDTLSEARMILGGEVWGWGLWTQNLSHRFITWSEFQGTLSEIFQDGLVILVGGLNPSEKYESQLGWVFPIYGKIKNVPNHQSDIVRWCCKVWSSNRLFPPAYNCLLRTASVPNSTLIFIH